MTDHDRHHGLVDGVGTGLLAGMMVGQSVTRFAPPDPRAPNEPPPIPDHGAGASPVVILIATLVVVFGMYFLGKVLGAP